MSEYRLITSQKKAKALSSALFLVGLAALIITQFWWPGIMLVLGLPLALKKFLTGRNYDMLVTCFVFLGTFITVQFDIPWQIFLPVLFSVGALYILIREFFGPSETTEDENEESLNHEIEEDKNP